MVVAVLFLGSFKFINEGIMCRYLTALTEFNHIIIAAPDFYAREGSARFFQWSTAVGREKEREREINL